MSKLTLDDYKECKANCKCFFGVYDMRKTYGICLACRDLYHKIDTLIAERKVYNQGRESINNKGGKHHE